MARVARNLYLKNNFKSLKVFNKYLIITLLLFGILFALIAIVNHYCFRTYALDLGAYTNALWDYAHLQWNDSSVFKSVPENLLADHFDLYLVIFSPLIYLFGTYTLLIVQIIAVLFGAFGIYKYLLFAYDNKKTALLGSIAFLMFFGVFSAIAFDYHSNVVATMFVPWLLLQIKKSKFKNAFLFLILIVIAKENMALWTAFIFLGLMIEYRKNKKEMIYLLLFFVFSLCYFIIITFAVMPAISVNHYYPQFKYAALGSTPTNALAQLFTHPVESAKMFFTNHTHHPHGDFVKTETFIFLILSGLLFLLRKPAYLIMLIPIFFQKMFHDNYVVWSIGYQYNIEFAPILVIGSVAVISLTKKPKFKKILLGIFLAGIFFTTQRSMDATIFFTNKSQIRFYQSSHYSRDFDVKKVHRILKEIPDDAIVSAQNSFVPHLALRENVYQFPIIKNAEYVIYSPKEDTYPLTDSLFKMQTLALESSGNWDFVYHDKDIVLLKRKFQLTE
jgi:uncharacterized membrane protein